MSAEFSFSPNKTQENPYWVMAMQILEAKCAWLKHDWDSAVDEAADFTGCACKTRESIVPPTSPRKPEEGSYFYMNTELRNAERSCRPQPLQTADTSSTFLSTFHSPLPRRGSATGLGRADIIVFCLCHVVRKLRVWCNWWSLFEPRLSFRKLTHTTLTKVWLLKFS